MNMRTDFDFSLFYRGTVGFGWQRLSVLQNREDCRR